MTAGPSDGAPELPLSGIRVIELANLLPGPACAWWLAALGADVLKIEPPGGDPARSLYGGRLFDAVNAGKRSVVLDLKDEQDRCQAQEYAQAADVLIDGFRPGVATRLGLGDEQIRATNPDVIYCSIIGYDPFGPDAVEPSHDLIFVARSGMLALPGGWASQREAIHRPGLPVADIAGAMTAAASILAALVARGNGAGGQTLVIPIYDAFVPWVALRSRPGETGETVNHLDPANDLYTCGDGGRLAIAAVEDKFWQALCAAAGDTLRPFASLDSETRQVQGNEVAAALQALFDSGSAAHWESILRAGGVPAAVVARPGAALADPALTCRAEHGYPLPNFGFGRSAALSAPPALNEVCLERS